VIDVALLVTASSVEAEGGYHLPMNDEKIDFENKKISIPNHHLRVKNSFRREKQIRLAKAICSGLCYLSHVAKDKQNKNSRVS